MSNNSQSQPITKDLIRLAQADDQDAFEKLIDCYTPLIEAMTNQFCPISFSSQDREDLHQEALLAFCSAIAHYRTEIGEAPFGAFAKVCIQNRLISYLRTLKKRETVLPLEDHEALLSEQGTEKDPADQLVQEEAYLALYRSVRATLSDYENRVWWLYLSGQTAKEVALALGSDEKSIQNAIYRIRRKLRQIIPHS